MLPVLALIFSPLIAAILMMVTYCVLKDRIAILGLIASATSAFLILMLGKAQSYQPTVYGVDWVIDFGVRFSFLVDGLSIFFGLVVSVMGFFVVSYAMSYMPKNDKENGKFYTYLMLFMFAMLGTVFSNNLIVLFLFWEMTGVASFLLIGFNYTKPVSQMGSRMAFVVTASTGLVMLVGVLMLGNIFGTFELNQIASNQPVGAMANLMGLTFVLVIIGAFGKSAQFPFHFWLPNAMAAPTPVSAYLHSAAMVKLGIFLTARIFPIFSDLGAWAALLPVIGFLTMLIGAMFSVLSHDIKGILAYTTVSQLGYLIGFYGLGGTGVEHDFLQVINHVFYKGSLFMIAGIVIHCFHTKDIREMGGAFKTMPMTAIATIFACAGMGGIPLTTGFLSKELMIEHILHSHHPLTSLLIVMLAVSAICLVATGIRLVYQIFFGEVKGTPYKPSLLFQLPPFILASCLVIYGILPGPLTHFLEGLVVPGLHVSKMSHIHLWHGFNTAFKISLSVMILGTLLFLALFKQGWRVSIPSFLRVDIGFNAMMDAIPTLSSRIYDWMRIDTLTAYVFVVMSFFAVFFGGTFLMTYTPNWSPFSQVSTLEWYEILIPVLVGGAVLGVVILKTWISKLMALSVAGLLISFFFFLFKAPDLALTQLLIEVVSLVLMLFLLKRFTTNDHRNDVALVDAAWLSTVKVVISIAVGCVMFLLVHMILVAPADNLIGQYFIDKTIALAEGHNAVNTILVDFRGFDTMGEISVLTIAMIGVVAMLSTRKKKKELS